MNADPRRPEKVQRYVPKSNNGTGTEDLTPDYMNILGQPTANVAAEATDKQTETSVNAEPNLQAPSTLEEVQHTTKDEFSAPATAVTTAATNVIPTSPQYGVAIIPNATSANDVASETLSLTTETVTDTTAKSSDENKDLHSTPNRNDRFKVVKIASLEPFKRGRWKCMDYMDEAPPAGSIRIPQSSGSIQITSGPFMQTQSLPQQQIQQMLLQGGFTNGTQFFTSVPTQMLPQGQYFYPQMTNTQGQSVPQQVSSTMPAQFINNQPYFAAGMVQNAAGFTMPQNFPNIQYVPANLVPNQNNAFVPTSQTVQIPANFQQSQTYAGQPSVSQANVIQPLVNGHNFTPQTEQQMIGTLPTQNVKNVILNATNSQPVVSQSQIPPQQQQNLQNQVPVQTNPNVSTMQSQQFQQNYQSAVQNQPQSQQAPNQTTSTVVPIQVQPQSIVQTSQIAAVQSQSNMDQNLANNVYTNPQFAMSVNSLTVFENSDNPAEVNDTCSIVEVVSENPDDPAKTNPVVNAIDNKIEQAMDLVKSHLMYTVREEVEVLKEKIAELMEKIQQLETENNFLRSQIPKTQVLPPNPSQNQPQTQAASSSNPSPSYIPTSNPNPNTNLVTPVSNTSPNTVPVAQVQPVSSGENLKPQQ